MTSRFSSYRTRCIALSFRRSLRHSKQRTLLYERKKIVVAIAGKRFEARTQRGSFRVRGIWRRHLETRAKSGRTEFYAPPLKANGNRQQWGLSWWPVTALISFCQSRVDSRGLQYHDKQTGTRIARRPRYRNSAFVLLRFLDRCLDYSAINFPCSQKF